MRGHHHPMRWALPIVLVFALGACNLPGPGEPPRCTPEELQAPENLAPHLALVDPSELVTLSWTYPVSSCTIDGVEVYVWTGPEPVPPGITGNTSANFITWPIPLQPGDIYFWRAYAEMETGPGPDVQGPSSAVAWFYTGPVCSSDITSMPVELVYPPDNAVVDASEGLTFAWDYPAPCMHKGAFELQISLYGDFSSYLHRDYTVLTGYPITPSDSPIEVTDCTRYYWRVKTETLGLEDSLSETWSFFVDMSPVVLCPSELPPLMTPLAKPPELPPPMTPLAEATATAKQNLNCRSGPGSAYKIADTFFEGASAPIEGRNEDSTWWRILSPNLGIYCWVWGKQVEVIGDVSQVPLSQAPPLPPIEGPATETPTPVPVNCSQYKDPRTCDANPACRWYMPITGGGFCTNR